LESLKEGHEVQGDNNKQRCDKRDQCMCEVKQFSAMCSSNEPGWAKKVWGHQVGVNTEGKYENEWEDDEAEACADSLRSSQPSV
jgi:hypothetical protein